MCIILHAAQKNIIKTCEFYEAMRRNPSGFFIAELLKSGKRNTLRTTSSSEASEFWDKIPDESEVVLHFRVPSQGSVSDKNVHGWCQDRILFCHNRTLFNIEDSMVNDGWDGTDSEYFFRKIFIPLYRKLGGDGKAYCKDQFCPLLDRVVCAICGTYNKFLFIMPDNAVIRYGEWEGDDPDRPGLHASNRSYLEAPREEGLLSKLFSWTTWFE